MNVLCHAKYIIQQCIDKKVHIDYMKLQMLLYFAQGAHLAMQEKPLFEEKIHATQCGIHIDEVAKPFRYYGSVSILDTKTATFGIVNGRWKPIRNEISDEQPTSQQKEVLDFIIEKLAHVSTRNLRNQIYKHEPWIDAREIADVWDHSSVVIKQRDIQQFFTATDDSTVTSDSTVIPVKDYPNFYGEPVWIVEQNCYGLLYLEYDEYEECDIPFVSFISIDTRSNSDGDVFDIHTSCRHNITRRKYTLLKKQP